MFHRKLLQIIMMRFKQKNKNPINLDRIQSNFFLTYLVKYFQKHDVKQIEINEKKLNIKTYVAKVNISPNDIQ